MQINKNYESLTDHIRILQQYKNANKAIFCEFPSTLKQNFNKRFDFNNQTFKNFVFYDKLSKSGLNEEDTMHYNNAKALRVLLQCCDIFIKEIDNEQKKIFIDKISRFKNIDEFLNEFKKYIHALINIFTHEKLVELIEERQEKTKKSNLKDGDVEIKLNNYDTSLILFQVRTSDALNQFCSHTNWCIKSSSTFNSYENKGKQLILFNFNILSTEMESVIGITLERVGDSSALHNDEISKTGKNKKIINEKFKYSTAHILNDQHISLDKLKKIALDYNDDQLLEFFNNI